MTDSATVAGLRFRRLVQAKLNEMHYLIIVCYLVNK